ncbi:NAD(P)/FAD-dependent oxidoreductase (plasmid) [Deinococcus sp. KNUC1210]|uniref:NAD(P)/FAD-dependent oxidoreductase n=1 Tax=Deinococcus sp. KNUC1210 TaxID=2917691 RepID=UPI001EF0D7ED|nr:NAD(P)/FAD-dependent oxidoreductase [Deinococcus sp. KNUC1210]ULH18035.1 NAD(P)/FAD-dependent oxidoreductase [Deinococcus sp. KNUC1210]
MTSFQYDVLIIGGGFAGLSAALYTARGMKRAFVCSAGPSRNAPSLSTHGVLTRDGTPPAEFLQTAHAELDHYDVPRLNGRVVQLTGQNNAFIATLENGETVQARKIILATGVRDVLPDTIPGLREEWGRGVHHCPYCYGWEVQGGPIALYQPGLNASHIQSVLYHQKISPNLLVCSDTAPDLSAAQRQLLKARHIEVIDEPLVEVESTGPGVRLTYADGNWTEHWALYAHSERVLNADLAVQLGCEATAASITVNAKQETTVPGVYAAGDVSSGNQVIFALASGASAAMYAGYTLFDDDLPADARAY